jgi:hypothetical protein
MKKGRVSHVKIKLWVSRVKMWVSHVKIKLWVGKGAASSFVSQAAFLAQLHVQGLLCGSHGCCSHQTNKRLPFYDGKKKKSQ